MLFRHPQLLALLALIPVFAAAWRLRRSRIPALALIVRLAIVALIVAAIADPVLGARAGAAEPLLAVVVDQSDSLSEAGRQALLARAEQIMRASPGRAQAIYFGGRTAAEPLAGPSADGLEPSGQALRPAQTDIAAALRAARALVGRSGGRIVLLSDGIQTRGDAIAAAQVAGAGGVPIDTIGYQAPPVSDVWVQSVDAPPTLREGEEFEIQIDVGSTSEGQALLRVSVGGAEVAAQNISVRPGQNSFRYSNRAARPGILTIQAQVEAQPDALIENDSLAATTLVAAAPRVLLVSSEPSGARILQGALQPLSINTELATPAQVPTQLSLLDQYESVVLIDVPAAELSLDQMAALREFVRSEGRGLVAVGGRSSFTLGAYKDTPLEEALPVSMSPPKRAERSDITLLLIMDQSASMGPDAGDSKFNMAKEASILATESLRESDRIGVLAFDIGQRWVVEFQLVGQGLSMTEIQERISSIPLGGGTDILGALQAGLPALEQQPGKVRHAVLITDGRSFTTNRAAYRAVVEQMQADDITLSTIAIGSDADTDLLREMAQLGGGRYHFASRPDDIPRLTLMESEILRTEPQVEGDFRASQNAPHPAMRNFTANDLPDLQGYVATTAKPEAEVVLQSPENDPVLAAWQYGLGRAVAWTPGVEAPWAANWSNWSEYGRFWAQIIRYTLPEPDSGPLQVRVTPHEDGVTIGADIVATAGEPLDLADVAATITLPDGSARQITLRQSAPGRYTEDVALPGAGAYALLVEASKGSDRLAGRAGYVERYSDEYLPAEARSGSGPLGAELLAAISAASGGQALAESDVPQLAQSAAAQSGQPLWQWFLLAAAALWPLEIAIRRGWLLPR
jgi:Mg-chelatase subunit ChlD